MEQFFQLQKTIKQYELSIECIKVNEEIGEGCFGKVRFFIFWIKKQYMKN